VARVTLSRTSPCCSQLGSLLALPDGRIVAVGRDSETKRRLALTRFTAAGALDPSFGKKGVVFDAGQPGWGQVVDVFAQGQKIAAVGWANREGRYHYVLRRFTAAGALDLSFGQNGRVSTLTNAPALAAFVDTAELLVAGAGDPDAPGLVFARYQFGLGS
jgi:uncharacterized delta-60 repeat protein